MQALLIIDVQNDYFPGGRMELTGAVEALAAIRRVLTRFREQGRPVIFVRHVNTRPGAAFFLPGTEGEHIRSEIAPREGESVVVKHAPDSFYRTNLAELIHVRGIDSLLVCGMMTHMCVDTTVRAAMTYGLPVTLMSDGCATRDLEYGGKLLPAMDIQEAFLAAMNGIFATVLTSEQVLRDEKSSEL